MNKPAVYMDNQATTRVDPRVVEAMVPYFDKVYGNPASRTHVWGWDAEEAVQTAREKVATLVGATAREIIFSSGATEANNLAIKGALAFYSDSSRRRIVTLATEHHAVVDSCRALQRDGLAEVVVLKPARNGIVDLDELCAAVDQQTVLVSVMHANNEIGVIQPLEEIGRIAHQAGALFHTDAAQSVGKIAVNVDALGVDLLSLSGHKIYGPKGIGALYVRSRGRRVRLVAQMDGGGHERGLRSGTLNVPAIVGLGVAADICCREMEHDATHTRALRERLRQRLFEELDEVYLNGDLRQRLPGNLNVSFAHVEGESLLIGLGDIALSSGSACTSASLEPSYVLKALGVSDELAHASIRFGLGRFNSDSDVDYVGERTVAEVRRLRRFSPFYGVKTRVTKGSDSGS
ncbi:MAG: IscS subfamily cysteine desulfurase [Deltaproteobacteria bacterium]